MSSLYELMREYEQLDEMLSEGAQLDDPVVADILEQWSRDLRENLEAKADGYAAFIRELQARADARSDEARRLQKLARSDTDLADRLKDYLKDAMIFTGAKKMHTPRFRLSVCGDGGKAPLLVRDERAAIEAGFYAKVIDPSGIREALEAGEALPFAEICERGTHLRIA